MFLQFSQLLSIGWGPSVRSISKAYLHSPFPSRMVIRRESFWKMWLARALTRKLCCDLWMDQKPRWREGRGELREKRVYWDPGLWRKPLRWASQHLREGSEQLWPLLETAPLRELLLRTFRVHLMAPGPCCWLCCSLYQGTHMNSFSHPCRLF